MPPQFTRGNASSCATILGGSGSGLLRRLVLRIIWFALVTFVVSPEIHSASEEDYWGYWLLVELPVAEGSANSSSDTGRIESQSSSDLSSAAKSTLRSQRMAVIKTEQQHDYSHLPDFERLTIHGLDENGAVVFSTTVRDPRVLRMETLDDDGNRVDYGTIRRGKATISIPVPRQGVVRLEVLSQAAASVSSKARSLLSVGEVRIN